MLWFTILACTDLWCRVVRCSALYCISPWEGNGGRETQSERNTERVTGWEGETGEKRVSRGSEWLECALRLSEWAARWAGGYWRYCVEAAGVTVAVTDTKTTFHGRRYWLKAVARSLPTDHTLSINKHFFLWRILCDWLWRIFVLLFFFCPFFLSKTFTCRFGAMPLGIQKTPPETLTYNSENACLLLKWVFFGQLAVGGGGRGC